jgi:UDP-2,3-diacylglucosamine pyrophosphatase LpxH
MFDWLLHSKTRLRMMKMFFKDMTKPLYGLEIAQALKASPGTTHRELNAMLKKGIITKKKEGALVMYRLDQSHPYFHELKRAIFPKKKTNRVLFISDLHLTVETPADIMDDLELFFDYAEDNASEVVLLGDIVELLHGDVFQTYLFHKPFFDRVMKLSQELKVTYVVGNHDCFLETLCHEGQAGKLFGANIHFAREYTNTKLNIFASHGHQSDDFSVLKTKKIKKPAQCNGTEVQKLIKQLNRNGLSMHQNQLKDVASYAAQSLQYAQFVTQYKHDSSPQLLEAAKEMIHNYDYSYVVFGHSHKSALKALKHGIYFNTGSWKSEKKRKFVEIDNEGGALVDLGELK